MARMDMEKFFALVEARSEEIISPASLQQKLASRRRLRVKLGIDPTSPELHLGHVVPLRLLRAFQDAGHQAVVIIGDFTAQVGDSSGRDTARRQLTPREARENRRTYRAQIGRILKLSTAELHYNSGWFSRMRLGEFMTLLTRFPLKSAWEREDFQERLRAGKSVHLHEAMYHVLQGYDSVVVRADVELGAVEQRLNLLAGRELQQKLGYPPQDVVLLPYLIGLDGKQKMSKSISNTINLRDSAEDMFGKTMSIPDGLIIHYAELAAWMSLRGVEIIRRRLARGENPRDVKLDVAEALVSLYHGKERAQAARQAFIRTFSRRETPSSLPVRRLARSSYRPVELVMALGAASSNAEARRLLAGGAVEVDGQVIRPREGEILLSSGNIVRVGKKKFYRLALGKQ